MRVLVRVAVLAAATLALVGCSTTSTPTQAPEPGIVHVHALALDPADPSALYIATHTGLFHVDGTNNAQRVGGHYHDLMGFTAAGPGDFIASGHPDLRTKQLLAPGKPPLLGLVHSRDGGAQWRPLSLLGDADFHSLQAAHGLVYGYDSTGGRFMVSRDRTTWETRSSLSLMDFAVSPADPNVVVASTWQQGVLASTDGGRSWQPTTSGAFVVLDWADSALYGLTPNGTLGVSRDGGMTWQQQGSIGGSPEALLATDDMLVAAAADRGIVQSRDGGRTWTVRLSTAAHRPSS
jgi:hypothetical protein